MLSRILTLEIVIFIAWILAGVRKTICCAWPCTLEKIKRYVDFKEDFFSSFYYPLDEEGA